MGATVVLVLILSAAFAATRALRREGRWGLAFYSGIFCLVFSYTLAENCLGRPDSLIIGTVFTLLLMLACAVSRSIRSVELHFARGYFGYVESWHIGPQLRGKKVLSVPIENCSLESRRKKGPRSFGITTCTDHSFSSCELARQPL